MTSPENDPAERNEDIDAKIRDLTQHVERIILDAKLELPKRAQNRSAYVWLSFIVAGVSCGVMGLVLMDMMNVLEIPEKTDAGWLGFRPGSEDDGGPASLDSLLTTLIPVVTLAVAFFVGATGLKRLSLYDEEFRANRGERREEMNSLKAELVNQIERGESVSRNVARSVAHDVVENRLKDSSDRLASVTGDVKRELDGVASDVDQTINQIESRLAKLDWVLKSDNGLEEALVTEIGSMGELHERLTELGKAGELEASKKLVDRYFDPNDFRKEPGLRGSADDFFNAATQMAKADLEPYSHRICEGGLNYFPSNPDLLSNALKFASDSGEKERAEELFATIQAMDDSEKNWRVWVFTGDYVRATKEVKEIVTYYRTTYLGRFFDDNWERLAVQPKDALSERMMAQLARYYERMERRAEAIEVAEKAVEHCSRAPQCAGILSSLYLEAGDYEKTIWASDLALEMDTRDESNVNQSAQMMHKACAYDAQFYQAALSGDGTDIIEKARLALLNYARTMRSIDLIGVFLSQIQLRTNAIVSKLEELGVSPEQILTILPKELNSFAGVQADGGQGPDSSSDNTDFFRELMLKVKLLSEVGGEDHADGIDAIVREIQERGLAGDSRRLLRQTADHFRDDPDEESFVSVLDEIVKRLS